MTKNQSGFDWKSMNGKQVRVARRDMLDGKLATEYIAENANDIWLHENEMWDVIHQRDISELDNVFDDSDSNDTNHS